MKNPWRPVNSRLKKHIPGLGGYGGIEVLIARGCKWYGINGLNKNHSNFSWGGFWERISDALERDDYVVDLRAGLIAKSSDLGW